MKRKKSRKSKTGWHRFYECYPMPNDLHDAIIESRISYKYVAISAGINLSLLHHYLAGHIALPDEVLLNIIDILNFPAEFRPFPEYRKIKNLMQKYHVGLKIIAKRFNYCHKDLKNILDGYKYIGGPAEEGHILSFIKQTHESRSPELREFLSLVFLDKKKKTEHIKSRMKILGTAILEQSLSKKAKENQ